MTRKSNNHQRFFLSNEFSRTPKHFTTSLSQPCGESLLLLLLLLLLTLKAQRLFPPRWRVRRPTPARVCTHYVRLMCRVHALCAPYASGSFFRSSLSLSRPPDLPGRSSRPPLSRSRSPPLSRSLPRSLSRFLRMAKGARGTRAAPSGYVVRICACAHDLHHYRDTRLNSVRVKRA